MVSAPARSAEAPHAVEHGTLAPIRVRLPEEALAWERFVQLSDDNPGYRFERCGTNELVISMGSGRESDVWAGLFVTELNLWRRAGAGGNVAASAAISEAEDGSWLIADASWMSDARRAASGGESGEGPGAVPELVVEIRSWTDRLENQHEKMRNWMMRGVELGWLVDPYARIVWVYRPGRDPEELDEPDELRGDPELPGFVMPLAEVWAPRADVQ